MPMRRCASRSSWKSCKKWWNDSFRPSRRPEMPRKVKKIQRARRRPALAILSRKKTLYSTRRLLEAATARGFRTRGLDVLLCNLRPELEGAILKLTQGTQGVGVMIAHSAAEVESILGTLWGLGQEILLQEFVAESRGRDIRALVVGDRVVGAMRREAPRGEFRSNLHRGGFGSAVQLAADYAEAAVRAAQVVGLDVAGVDLLESNDGPKVVELNSSPGFEGLERATGLDIAAEIVAFAARVAEGARRVMAL